MGALINIDRSAEDNYNNGKESLTFHDKIGLLRALRKIMTVRLQLKP